MLISCSVLDLGTSIDLTCGQSFDAPEMKRLKLKAAKSAMAMPVKNRIIMYHLFEFLGK